MFFTQRHRGTEMAAVPACLRIRSFRSYPLACSVSPCLCVSSSSGTEARRWSSLALFSHTGTQSHREGSSACLSPDKVVSSYPITSSVSPCLCVSSFLRGAPAAIRPRASRGYTQAQNCVILRSITQPMSTLPNQHPIPVIAFPKHHAEKGGVA